MVINFFLGNKFYVNKDSEYLQKNGYLHHIYKVDDDTNLMMVLEDIPVEWLDVRPCKYSEINKIFKQILKASGENKFKRNLMYWAVWNNLKYFCDKPEGLDKSILFKSDYGNIPKK